MLGKQSIKTIQGLPQAFRSLLIKATLLLAGWLLLYHGFLKPTRLLDKPFTNATIWGTTKALGLFYHSVTTVNQYIYADGKYAVAITDPCNALELFVLYIGFLICIKTNLKRFATFAIGGSIVVYLLNIIRCAGLAYLNLIQSPLIEFAHHYAFKLIIYGVIFLGWTIYAKKEKA